MAIQKAKFSIGDIVKHKHFEFRGVIYDVDFEFNNSEEWYQSIPKNVRPRKDQPFYHLLAEMMKLPMRPTCQNKTYYLMTLMSL
jgi:heat shock protein HspQ